MTDTIKIGKLDVDYIKIGQSDVDAVYVGQSKVWPNGTPPIDYTKEYLTFEPISSAVTFAYKKATVNYSLDSGTTWNSITTSQTVTVNVGEKIMWRATLGSSSDDGNPRFTASGGTWKAYGNLLSMIGNSNFSATTTVTTNRLQWLFSFCDNLVDIDNLKIPATTVNTLGLRAAFRGCGGLTRVPEDLLPATSIGTYGYMGMFEDCANLTNTPILPASTVSNYGYMGMFNNCASLTTCTCLLTSNIGGNRTQIMLSGVAENGTFYKHPNATWPIGQYGVPSSWTIVDYTS